MNTLVLKALNTLNSIATFRLTNLQRFQALSIFSFFWGAILMPHSVLAQIPGGPLTNGAGQNTGGTGAQCGQNFWFMSNLYSFIATAFAGLGGAAESVCQVINIVVIGGIILMVGMILWGLGDHHMNETPLKKAFSPFMGWLIGLVCIYLVIFVAFFSSAVGGNVGRAPGVI